MDILDLSGNTIRSLRENLNWSREFLSEKSGVPARTIQDIEAGVTKNPGLETIKSLLRALPNYSQTTDDPKRSELFGLIGRLPDVHIDTLTNLSKGLLGQSAVDQKKPGT